jgi:hypothetical protein
MTIVLGASLMSTGSYKFPSQKFQKAPRVLFELVIDGERITALYYEGKHSLEVASKTADKAVTRRYWDINNDQSLDIYLENGNSPAPYHIMRGDRLPEPLTEKDQQTYKFYLDKIKQAQGGN